MKPEISSTPDGYRLLWEDGIEALVERLTEHRDELTCELTVNSDRPPRPGLLHWGRFNISGPDSRIRLANKLEKREPDIDWAGVMEQLCVLVADRHRAGEPSIDMRLYIPPGGTRWVVEPFVAEDGPTVLFAKGGSGKSYLALAIALSHACGRKVAGTPRRPAGPVLYLDWETSPRIFHARVRALCAGHGVDPMPPVHYRRQIASLSEAAQWLRGEIARVGATLVVVDSLGYARGGEPESAEVTMRLFTAGRSLGVPWLAVDHVSKADGEKSDEPFGSVYTRNSARLMWGMQRAEDDEGFCVRLRERKLNDGRRHSEAGYRIEIEEADDGTPVRAEFRFFDPADSASLRAKMTVARQIEYELRRRAPQTVDELAEAIGEDPNTVARTLRRGLVSKFYNDASLSQNKLGQGGPGQNGRTNPDKPGQGRGNPIKWALIKADSYKDDTKKNLGQTGGPFRAPTVRSGVEETTEMEQAALDVLCPQEAPQRPLGEGLPD